MNKQVKSTNLPFLRTDRINRRLMIIRSLRTLAGINGLDGLLASTAIPPWFAPVEKDAQLIIDGGILSNLPIEPALTLSATEIIALDLMNDPAFRHENAIGATQQLEKLVFAVLQRQACVETALAKAQGVPVHYIQLRSSPPIPIWDFSKHRNLIEIGYDLACHEIANWHKTKRAETAYPALNSAE